MGRNFIKKLAIGLLSLSPTGGDVDLRDVEDHVKPPAISAPIDNSDEEITEKFSKFIDTNTRLDKNKITESAPCDQITDEEAINSVLHDVLNEINSKFEIDENYQEKERRYNEEREKAGGIKDPNLKKIRLDELWLSQADFRHLTGAWFEDKSLVLKVPFKPFLETFFPFYISVIDPSKNNLVKLSLSTGGNYDINVVGLEPYQVAEVINEILAWSEYEYQLLLGYEQDLERGVIDQSEYDQSCQDDHAYAKDKLQEKFTKQFGSQVKVD